MKYAFFFALILINQVYADSQCMEVTIKPDLDLKISNSKSNDDDGKEVRAFRILYDVVKSSPENLVDKLLPGSFITYFKLEGDTHPMSAKYVSYLNPKDTLYNSYRINMKNEQALELYRAITKDKNSERTIFYQCHNKASEPRNCFVSCAGKASFFK